MQCRLVRVGMCRNSVISKTRIIPRGRLQLAGRLKPRRRPNRHLRSTLATLPETATNGTPLNASSNTTRIASTNNICQSFKKEQLFSRKF